MFGLSEIAEPPLVPGARAEAVTLPVVLELRQTLPAHRGATPVHVRLGAWRHVLDGYPVRVTPMLLGELKSIPGFRTAAPG